MLFDERFLYRYMYTKGAKHVGNGIYFTVEVWPVDGGRCQYDFKVFYPDYYYCDITVVVVNLRPNIYTYSWKKLKYTP